MNIALVGTGRMGTAVQEAVADRGWTLQSTFDSTRPFDSEDPFCGQRPPDAVIDFSLPHLTLAHTRSCCAHGIPLVIGTTGWTDHIQDARDIANHEGGAILFSPNFSLGVAMLTRSVRAVAPLLNRLGEFDVSIHEVHHAGKRDSPSGTALRLAENLCHCIDRKTEIQHAAPLSVSPEVLQVTASRVGYEFGHHTIWIDGPADRLQLSHEARSRSGFANGALAAASWLQGRRGFFTLDDMLDDWLDTQNAPALKPVSNPAQAYHF